tara:strand:- start:2019 stop:3098 length:1080 start_codon:yes stop_codon:yes gene_type:complete
MLLPGFGEEGQRKLLKSKVLIAGCGALGTVVANTLARAGVGHLVIVDRDYIEITNLQRQILFDESDVENAIPKAVAAKEKIGSINSQIKVTAVVDDLNHTNIESMIEGCDVIVDGVDNFETRFLVNDVAVKHGVPYIYAGAVGVVGMCYTILPHLASPSVTSNGDPGPGDKRPAGGPCLRCIFEHAPPPGMNPTCDTVGVLGPVVSVIANYEAVEALKVITENWNAINRMMLHVDLWQNTMRQFAVTKAYEIGDCRCCKHRVFEYLDGKLGSSATTLCGRNAVQLTRNSADGHKLDFKDLASRLRSHCHIQVNKFMLRAAIIDGGHPYELTLFTDGRAIVKGTKQPEIAKSIYSKYVGG